MSEGNLYVSLKLSSTAIPLPPFSPLVTVTTAVCAEIKVNKSFKVEMSSEPGWPRGSNLQLPFLGVHGWGGAVPDGSSCSK